MAAVGKTVFVDVNRDAVVSDGDDAYSLLNVTALRSLDAPGRLNIVGTGAVTFDKGYTAGSTVKADGIEVEMLWETPASASPSTT